MDIIQIAELGGIVAVVGLFIWYLQKKDKRSSEKDDKFGNIISNHIVHSTKVQTELKDIIREVLRFLKNGKK